MTDTATATDRRPNPAIEITMTLRPWVRIVVRACGRWWSVAKSLGTWPRDWFRAFYGVEELDGKAITVSLGERRGYVRACVDCRDVHDVGQSCPRAMVGYCLDCLRTRRLDRFGNCERCGSGSVAQRRLTR